MTFLWMFNYWRFHWTTTCDIIMLLEYVYIENMKLSYMFELNVWVKIVVQG